MLQMAMYHKSACVYEFYIRTELTDVQHRHHARLSQYISMHAYMLHKVLMLSNFLHPEMCLRKSSPVIPELSALPTITIVCGC